ncbi:class I SAM-dependent methyltransferase [Cocleimonas sp. KMM 6892]|uniref:class I SAM-dependent DNA methyltransferase n=1 Tax=unclassified Cocleimonas TaxID=2639732 RepID=UPI002DBAAE2D|nr:MULTISPECIES: class I SAM-dependent methyltransferase [unclassified Cocleimonas]MEB8432951.1 class I SAM-dependent methyltransferase [Cocleimonas sp. KMM 6892]MEC4716068.1 class I SAM-dependent methyltransferase [Cocleimonas sp. KMM 6895]MEC4745529.1 class I SAM-dependent methyltransferase [Cocleimonas sp. KMM 6896]
MSKDFFKQKAGIYETDEKRVSNVDNIANTVLENVSLNQTMHLMDFGAGTGLLLERIAPYVKKITAIDISKSMIEQLEKKQDSLECEINIRQIDLVTENISDSFDGIISSMTMHHVNDIEAMFSKFYNLLEDGGVIAIADLDEEDGSFHTEDTGVYHFGFKRDVIANAAKQAGFQDVAVIDASVMHKPYGDFPIFLLTARKPENHPA